MIRAISILIVGIAIILIIWSLNFSTEAFNSVGNMVKI